MQTLEAILLPSMAWIALLRKTAKQKNRVNVSYTNIVSNTISHKVKTGRTIWEGLDKITDGIMVVMFQID